MQRDIIIYKKNNDIIRIENIQNYLLHYKTNTIGIVTRNDEYKEFNLKDLFQIDINTTIENINGKITDFIVSIQGGKK